MVNLGLNWSSLLGIILAVAGAGLYFLRSWRPKLARDHDIFFAAVGLLCGGILLFQGWRLDPILAFGQFLLTGAAIFFAAESIKLRGATTAQAKNRAQYIDEDRPVSNAYAYESYDDELERIEPEEDYPQRPRIRGSQDYRSSREGYDDEPRRRPSNRSSNNSSNNTPDRESPERQSRKRSSRPETPDAEPRQDGWNVSDDPEERPVRSRSSRPPASENRNPDAPPRKKKARPTEASRSRTTNRDAEATPSDYVEYRPVEYPEDQPENSTNFDK